MKKEMMPSYPYNFHYLRNYNYYPTTNLHHTKPTPIYTEYKKNKPCNHKDLSNTNTCSTNASSKTENLEYFEIFGIKLFFDDILLICLIFFLYSEGIKDQYLFIALILLLLS